ncbi:hypothetical protein [Hyphococcus sp.]|uniref:hypothetical protein n=1 Tax=Hyphococcus sp. TaxID=2038636 RepID=UPI0035C6E73F
MTAEAESGNLAKADGATCFVLGNGPSLRGVDLKSLSPYATIGLNAAYRYWREIDWRPQYYACLDTVVGLSHRDEIRALIEEGRIEKFLLRENLIEMLGEAGASPRVVNFDARRWDTKVLSLPAVTTGSHSALWAVALGYKTVVIIGVDAQYKELVSGARRREGIELEIVENGDNPNYFFDGYQRPGDKYNLPNPRPDLHVDAWRDTAAMLKETGVSVYNGNPNSAVRVFPFIDIPAFLSEGAMPVSAGEEVPPLAANEPLRGMARLQKFAGSNALLLLVAAVFLTAGVALFATLGVAAGPLIFAAGIIYSLFVFLLYVRMAVIEHLQRLQEQSDAMRALQKDLSRRMR